MTHKPKINKYLWLSAGKSWRFTTSTRHKLVVLFVFALCILPANLCGQSLAIKSNLLYDLTTSLNLGGEIRCDDTHTFSLSVNYNPWRFQWKQKDEAFPCATGIPQMAERGIYRKFYRLTSSLRLIQFWGNAPLGIRKWENAGHRKPTNCQQPLSRQSGRIRDFLRLSMDD